MMGSAENEEVSVAGEEQEAGSSVSEELSTDPEVTKPDVIDEAWDNTTVGSKDPLLGCLLILSKLHGRPINAISAVSGLPLDNGLLTPSLFERAAKRAELACSMVKLPITELNKALFPTLLLLEGGRACVLNEVTSSGKAKVIYPELDESETEISIDKLQSEYTGIAVYVRPLFRFDPRAPEIRGTRHKHWFWGAILEHKTLYKDVLKAAFLINSLALAVPLFTMNVYDRVVPNNATDTLWVLATGVFIVLIADFMLRTMRGYFIDLASSRIDVKLSSFIMERVLGIRMANRPISAGSFASNLRSFEQVRDFIASATVTALIDVPFALIFVLVIGWIAWPMALPIVVGMLVVIGFALSVQGKMHDLTESTYRAGAQRNATLIESLVGLETLKAMNAESIMQRKWEQSAAFLARVAAQLRLLSSVTINGTVWIQQLVNIIVVVLGVYLIVDNELSMGGLIAVMMLSSRALGPLGQVAGLLTQYHNAATALKTLEEIVGQDVERPDDANFVSRKDFKGEISFKDVSFSYPNEGTEALKHVSFTIQPGERVAILGSIGSGKTTLQKLMLGLYAPASGSVLLDGVDLRQLDPSELRRNIGYVPQDIVLFFGTLRDNIVVSAPHADDAAILRAADLGGLNSLVNRHPKGFDLQVGERGELLSGGQRQGIAIARAMINDPSILLMDEPTGSMDHSSEELIKKKLTELGPDKTIVLITHRTSLLSIVDRIIVIDQGKVVADGGKKQVIEALRQGKIGKAS